MKWIEVNNSLPEEKQEVFYRYEGGVFSGQYFGTVDGYQCFGGKSGWLCDDVTHWEGDELPEFP